MASTAQVTWVGPGLRLVGEGGHGPAIVLDHALPDEGRQESGPRPMELLLIGLAGCTSMDVVSVLQKKRQPFTGLQTKVTAERADEHPKVYTQIHVEYVVTGEGVKLAAGSNVTLIAHRTADGSKGSGDQLGLGVTASAFANDFTSTGRGKARVIVQHTAKAPTVASFHSSPAPS